jgi:hypothetical protein
MKGEREVLPIHRGAVIEGGGTYKGYEYIITFIGHGHRCGYVAVSDGDWSNDDDIDCHGGITFSSKKHGAKDLLPVACDDLWIGFDAAHAWDLPCYNTAIKYFSDEPDELDRINSLAECRMGLGVDYNASHKTYGFMEAECKSIIDQLIERKAA